MLKIGEIAKKTGISIRSLRHYDEIGLMKPSSHSEAGYRLYTKDDMLRLQQIVSLKQMGFSLKKVQSMLKEDTLSLQETLEMHVNFLHQKLIQQQHAYQQLKHVIDLLNARRDASFEVIYQTIEAIKMIEKYYTQEQLEMLKNRPFNTNPEEQKKFDLGWEEVFTQLKQLQKAGVPAEDLKTKTLAEKARNLIAAFTGGDPSIEASLQKMYEKEGGGQMLRNHGLDVSDSLYEYYEAVLLAHK